MEGEDIVRFIKAQRLRWLGHVMRMSQTRTPHAVYKTKMEGRRKPGRPRSRWSDETESDIRALRVSNWRDKVQNRVLERHRSSGQGAAPSAVEPKKKNLLNACLSLMLR